jgi:predicted nuclease of predicted toxin-antitoxin system
VTTLFAKVYLDENVDIRLAARLRHRVFCATTAHAVGLLRANDPTQLLYAASHGYCLITHNRRDFELLHQHFLMSNQMHSGIIIASSRDIYALTDRLIFILNRFTADEVENQLLYV